MQIARLLQAVVLMLTVAVAASCASTKEYAAKIFPTRTAVTAETAVSKPLRFLDTDSIGTSDGNWVTTDIIMGRDSSGSTAAIDRVAAVVPAVPAKQVRDSAAKKDSIVIPAGPAVYTEAKNPVVLPSPVARNANPGEVRSKRSRE